MANEAQLRQWNEVKAERSSRLPGPMTRPLVSLSLPRGLPVAFEAILRDATLLLATDGLLKYGRRDRIAVLARGADLQVAVRQLAELPRLRSGALPDDVGVILCRS